MSPRTETLQSHFGSGPEQPLRPILTSLNGDASWLMSFPLPPSASPRESTAGNKKFYHVVVDPWLKGPTSMISPWLIHIERTEPAAVPDAAGVDELVREIEGLAAAASGEEEDALGEDSGAQPLVDAIFIKVHLLDHLHRPTLEGFDGRIPVFATAEAAPTIRGWGHFDTVVETRDYKRYGGDDNSSAGGATGLSGVPAADKRAHWKSFHPGGPLPEWLSVFRLVGDWYVELATVVVWSHGSENNKNEQQHEFIINTPHGINVNTESVVAFFDDNVSKDSTNSTAGEVSQRRPGRRGGGMECLAMLAGFKDSYSFGVRETLGVERSLQLERKAGPKYWVKSHDLPIRVGGAVMRLRMMKEVIRTLEEGLEGERKERLKEGKVGDLRRPNLVTPGNGGCFVLE